MDAVLKGYLKYKAKGAWVSDIVIDHRIFESLWTYIFEHFDPFCVRLCWHYSERKAIAAIYLNTKHQCKAFNLDLTVWWLFGK